MQPGPPRRRQARPVGGAPIDELLGRSEDLAKGWLLALLEQAPLDNAPAILAAELVRDGPRLCEAAVRALADDLDLRRIEPGGALELLVSRTGRLAGTNDPEAVLRAVDALQAVIWSALRDNLGGADTDLVADLAQRLGLVMERIRTAALRGLDAAPEPLRVVESEAEAAPQPLWVRALEEEILQSERTQAPLSLLLVELEDADRLLAVERLERAGATFGRFAQAVRTVLRQRDLLARETDGRAWVIARATARTGAEALGERIAEAVRAAEPWRGAPLSVTVGVAVLGEDGHDRTTLVEAAEENRFAAAAQGVSILLRPEFDRGESGEPEG
jgi:GGDEF domain-containing protein